MEPICLAGAALVAVSGAQAAPRSGTLITTVDVTAGKPSEFKFTLSKKSVNRGIEGRVPGHLNRPLPVVEAAVLQ